MKFKKKPATDAMENIRRRPNIADSHPGSQQAFSYYSHRSNEQANTGRRDTFAPVPSAQPAIWSVASSGQKALYGILTVVVVACGIYALQLSPTPKVVLRQDAATAYFLQDKTVYQESAERVLDTSILNKNKLTVDTAGVKLSLLKSYPEIKSVDFTLPLLAHQSVITIEPYRPSFILTTTDSNAFLLDATGRALATTTQINNIEELDVPTLQDKTGITVRTGTRALPSTSISFTQTVLSALKAADVTASSLVLPAAAYELDVFISGTSYFVKFNLQEDPLQQAGTYLATKDRLATDKVKVGEYIDVRVPGRSYYK